MVLARRRRSSANLPLERRVAPRPYGHCGRGAFWQVVERLTTAEPSSTRRRMSACCETGRSPTSHRPGNLQTRGWRASHRRATASVGLWPLRRDRPSSDVARHFPPDPPTISINSPNLSPHASMSSSRVGTARSCILQSGLSARQCRCAASLLTQCHEIGRGNSESFSALASA